MRGFIITTCLVASGILILDSFNVGQALVLFLLVGIVPGTSVRISADQMLMLTALLLGFISARLLNQTVRSIHRQMALRSQPKAATLAK